MPEQRGYEVVRATDYGAAMVREPKERRKETIRQRAKGCLLMLSQSLIFEAHDIERATGEAGMKGHGYEALFERFVPF